MLCTQLLSYNILILLISIVYKRQKILESQKQDVILCAVIFQ